MNESKKSLIKKNNPPKKIKKSKKKFKKNLRNSDYTSIYDNKNNINKNIIINNRFNSDKNLGTKFQFLKKHNLRKSQKITNIESNKFLNIINEKNIETEKHIFMNDEELNTLEYRLAIKLDKRTYFQYYYSLLKKKHLILFSFVPNNDYNLMPIKISLFLLSFSLYFTLNGFFLNDNTMHKIYIESGSLSILNQIPQICFSSVITAVLNFILKLLSLSENNILDIKKEKNMKDAIQKSKKIYNCLKIKFFIFFILDILLISFFWYFISCFCAIYINTQNFLIRDTLCSFCLSMIYPFGLNLIPGCFRISALRAKQQDKKCLYKISGLIALI